MKYQDEKIKQVELSEVIQSLRKEISAAMDAGRDEALQFDVNHIEVELQTTIERDTEVKSEGKGTLKFLVEIGASLSGGETNKTAHSHLIRLNLTPLKSREQIANARKKGDVLVGDEDQF